MEEALQHEAKVFFFMTLFITAGLIFLALLMFIRYLLERSVRSRKKG